MMQTIVDTQIIYVSPTYVKKIFKEDISEKKPHKKQHVVTKHIAQRA